MIRIKNAKLPVLAKAHAFELKALILEKIKRRKSPLFEFIRSNIDTILSGTPKELEDIITNIPSIKGQAETLKAVFNYTNFCSNYGDKYGAYKLSNLLDIKVCCYCNRQYTFTLQAKRGKTRPEFDHFFCKSKYPYLALSFYNLIPSCHICNSNLKGTSKFTLTDNINPYLEDYENTIKFKIQLRNKEEFKKSELKKLYGINFYNGALESFDIKIKGVNPDSAFETRANNNIFAFHIETLYNGHKDYVVELIQKAEIYSPEYIDSLFKEYEGKLFSSIGDLHKMLLSNYVANEDFDKRVLSKLTRDISEELGIF